MVRLKHAMPSQESPPAFGGQVNHSGYGMELAQSKAWV